MKGLTGTVTVTAQWAVLSAQPGDLSFALVNAAGQIARWHLQGASQAIWPAVPLSLLGHEVRELALLERSFGLCVGCTDR